MKRRGKDRQRLKIKKKNGGKKEKKEKKQKIEEIQRKIKQ